jgi:SAM-dependent methyltransferase
MGVMEKLIEHCRKPTGWVGKLVARSMNFGHAQLADWGLAHVAIKDNFFILDIGCGGGRNVRKLSRVVTEGHVTGLDYAEESVAVARQCNKKQIVAGRVDIQLGSVSDMPFQENTFDLVTAVESHYFWPKLIHDFKEVMRVLKPGGTLLLVGEAYKGGKYDERNARWVELGQMHYHTLDEFRALVIKAGYTDVEVHENYDKGWICAVGMKPICE